MFEVSNSLLGIGLIDMQKEIAEEASDFVIHKKSCDTERGEDKDNRIRKRYARRQGVVFAIENKEKPEYEQDE